MTVGQISRAIGAGFVVGVGAGVGLADSDATCSSTALVSVLIGDKVAKRLRRGCEARAEWSRGARTMGVKRISITVSGRVQGVGYRYFAQETAEVMGVTGWVRNSFDRTVEIEAQADERTLDLYCSRLQEGPTLAYVTSLDRHDVPPMDGEASFEVRV